MAEIISELNLTNLAKENETENNGKLVLTKDGLIELVLEENAFHSLVTQRLENLETIKKRAKNPGGSWFRKILVNLLAKAVNEEEVIEQVEGIQKKHKIQNIEIFTETVKKKKYLTLLWGEARGQKFHFKENQFRLEDVESFQKDLKSFIERK